MLRRRGGPGLLSTMARTAVIAGTATAVSNRVSGAGSARAQQQQKATHSAAPPQSDSETMQAQLAGMQAQQAEVAALGESGAMMAHLEQLTQLKQAGMLTEAEFSAAKARLLAL